MIVTSCRFAPIWRITNSKSHRKMAAKAIELASIISSSSCNCCCVRLLKQPSDVLQKTFVVEGVTVPGSLTVQLSTCSHGAMAPYLSPPYPCYRYHDQKISPLGCRQNTTLARYWKAIMRRSTTKPMQLVTGECFTASCAGSAMLDTTSQF